MPNTSVPAAGEAMPAAHTPEIIVDRVQRLAEELQTALGEWANGQFSAVINPVGHPGGIHYRNVGTSPESRLSYAARAYKMAAQAVDPTVTEWMEWKPEGDNPCRFGIYGSRPFKEAGR